MIVGAIAISIITHGLQILIAARDLFRRLLIALLAHIRIGLRPVGGRRAIVRTGEGRRIGARMIASIRMR